MFGISEGSAESDHTFNFNYELQIKSRVSKTSQKLQFNDFPDLRESASSYNISMRRQTGDSFIRVSNQSKKTGERSFRCSSKPLSDIISPKFIYVDEPSSRNNEKDNQERDNSEHKSSQKAKLALTEQTIEKYDSHNQIQDKNQEMLDQIREYENKIKYLTSHNQNIQYETLQLEKEIRYFECLRKDNPTESQLMELMRSTHEINGFISRQKKIDTQLEYDREKLNIQLMNLCYEVDAMKFQRPFEIKDQAKAIIRAINQYHTELQLIKLNDSSLNMLQSERCNLPSIQRQVHETHLTPQQNKKQRQFFQAIVQEIKQTAVTINDPNYIKNIKYSMIKDEWVIFENAQLMIKCSYRQYPNLEIIVGNKSRHKLEEFSIKHNGIAVFTGEVLSSHKIYTHHIKTNKFMQPFQKILISYQPQQNSNTSIPLFIPTNPLKTGEFLPVTEPEFDQQQKIHRDKLLMIKSQQFYEVDRKLFKNDVEELGVYYPNMVICRHKKDDKQLVCKGIFQLCSDREGALVFIYKKQNTFKIQVMNNIPFLLGSLEFLLGSL